MIQDVIISLTRTCIVLESGNLSADLTVRCDVPICRRFVNAGKNDLDKIIDVQAEGLKTKRNGGSSLTTQIDGRKTCDKK